MNMKLQANAVLMVEADIGATYQRWNMQRVTTTISCGSLYDLRTNRYYKTQTNEVVRYVAPQESRTLSQNDLLGMQSKRKIIVTFILMLLIVTTACSNNKKPPRLI